MWNWMSVKHEHVPVDIREIELRTIAELMPPGELGNGIPRHLTAYSEVAQLLHGRSPLSRHATPEEIAQRTLDVRYHFAPRVSSYYLNRFIILKRETE